MMKQKSTKRALLTSVLALLVCISMLIGSTFAWFTDTVTSGTNKIVAGNLDVVLEYKTDWADEWATVDENTKIFNEKALYEPGYTEVVYLRVSNSGSLALKYKLMTNIVSEKTSTNVDGETFKLSDHLYIGTYLQDEYSNGANYADILMPIMFGTRESALSNVKLTKLSEADSVITSDRPILADEQTAQVMALVLTMPEAVGNEANHKSDVAAPEIELGLSLVATQFTDEYDSFDNQYDKDAEYPEVMSPAPADAVAVSSFEQLKAALANGGNIKLTANVYAPEALSVSANAAIYGQGYTISREAGYTGTLFNVEAGNTLTLENITLDGAGAAATGNLIKTLGNGNIVLNKGAVLQNNTGAHAVYLETRGGGSLTMNGAQIINNSSDSGAIWGGGNIIVNEGSKISGNSSTGSAGAIRMVSSCNLTMNGGEISNNTAAADGGAIWGYGSSTYNFNGGVMANNEAKGSGGAMYTGDSSVVNISGEFELSGNKASDAGALRLSNRTSFNMSGGKVSGNISVNSDQNDGFYGWNPAVNITGGELADSILIQGGLTPTVGGNGITGIVNFDLSTNHYNINLASEFGTVKFTVNTNDEHFINCNFKPAEGYTYTAGDEEKLVCMNDGYSVYWNAEEEKFCLKADN